MIPKRRGLILAALTLSTLAACNPGGLSAEKRGAFAPGTKPGAEAVDGLLVGHRLMEAGEYELALKAYYRAAGQHGATAEILSGIGSADLKLGRLNQAEQMLRRATEADQTFVPAWNNLGVVLMERGKYAEAARVFKLAFALDSGQSDAIKQNLKRALAKIIEPGYAAPQDKQFTLVRKGVGDYLLLTKH
ncbi:tetratricopeptide repeat protein [Thioclava sp. ES.031]|uniref:tetratricopeptide repeat protein n=1 Tax=Thioclava sp. ES.031 TaxID=1798203 RepID=UPI000BF4A87D|nr:tetratricopeptide repeat protein [Thioclava sp. ES.031]PFG61938.1 tetratricopeptide repeat protein [Thioclava sp. ES.031]